MNPIWNYLYKSEDGLTLLGLVLENLLTTTDERITWSNESV